MRTEYLKEKTTLFQAQKFANRIVLVTVYRKSFPPPQKISLAGTGWRVKSTHRQNEAPLGAVLANLRARSAPFAASGNILKGCNPFKAAFFGTFFAEAKKVRLYKAKSAHKVKLINSSKRTDRHCRKRHRLSMPPPLRANAYRRQCFECPPISLNR